MNNNLLFFKVTKNGKTPIKNENFSDPTKLKKLNEIKTNYYNVGLPCKANNLIILDIDVKDDGLIEWYKYLESHDEPLTVCQKSANGGLHYFFKHHSDSYDDDELELIQQLKNKSKYRNGKGLDVRKNNGYVVCEPSVINNNKYEFIRHYNKTEIINIPKSLLLWLLEYEKNEKDIGDSSLVLIENEKIIKKSCCLSF